MKTILSLSLIFFFALGAIAQSSLASAESLTPEQQAEKMTNQLSQSLELDDNMKSKVYQVALSSARNLQELESIKVSHAATYKSKMANLVKDTDARILQVLDPDRAVLYRELVRQREADAAHEEAVQQRLQSNGN
ncbi:MAG: hypothetical protein AAF502_10395 [Bacteroidota bacterium]